MENIREIEYEYARLREKALRERDERAQAAYAAIPRLKEIDEERREVAFSLGEKLRSGGDAASARALTQEAIACLNGEEEALLQMYGLDPCVLKPRFSCSVCGDTGYVGGAEKNMCRCMLRRLADARYKNSSIHPGERFETFRTDIYPSDTQKKLMLRAKSVCENFADAFPDNAPQGLLLMGNAGLGKSFLLNCMANRVYERGFGVYKLASYNLIETVMKGIRSSGMPDFLSPELLVVDDLGTEQMIPNITRETLFSVINERQAANRATLVATNLSLDKLMEFYGERLFSRLVAPRHYAVLKLEGANLHIALK